MRFLFCSCSFVLLRPLVVVVVFVVLFFLSLGGGADRAHGTKSGPRLRLMILCDDQTTAGSYKDVQGLHKHDSTCVSIVPPKLHSAARGQYEVPRPDVPEASAERAVYRRGPANAPANAPRRHSTNCLKQPTRNAGPGEQRTGAQKDRA